MFNRSLKLTLLLAFSFVALPALAQVARQYAFRHFSVSDGLSASSVYAVTQDKQGFMWIGTVNGLQRYDGHYFLTFQPHDKDTNSLPSSIVPMMFCDKANKLWLSQGNNVVGYFDTRQFKYHKVRLPKDISVAEQRQHFAQMQTGELLLIKDARAVYKYAPAANAFLPAESALGIPANWHVNEVHWDAHISKYWISSDSGLLQFDPVTKQSLYRGHNPSHDPVIAAMGEIRGPSNVITDGSGNVAFEQWIPTAVMPTLFLYNRQQQKMTTSQLWSYANNGYHEIGGMLKQRNGKLWIYGMPMLLQWQTADNSFQAVDNRSPAENGIHFKAITHAFEDRENNIWLATDNGVFLFNPDEQIFNSYSLAWTNGQVREADVTGVAELPGNRILVSCWEGGIFCYDQSFNPVSIPKGLLAHYNSISVWDMAVHSRTGKLWIVQQAGFLDVYDPNTEQRLSLHPDIFGGATIRQVDEDTSGNMWFGTHSGKLIKWDYKKSGGDPNKGYELILKTATISKVHYDYQGFIYVSTWGDGLLKVDTRTNKVAAHYKADGPEGERLYTNSPGDMTYYNDSTLLIANECLNILNTRTGKISWFRREDGLPSNTVQCIQRDKTGIVWMGMINGICRLNFKQKLVSFFDRRDGMSYDKFVLAGVEQLHDGRMVFFTDRNFQVFDPKAIARQNIAPQPVITSFSLSGQPLSMDSLRSIKNIQLRYNKTSIAINFSALTYLQQKKVHFYYKLEGLDQNWIHSDHPIEAIYNFLPPGNYTFLVRTENVDGMANSTVAALPIVVSKPFYLSWWFYSLLGLLVITVIYLLDRERLNKKRSMQEMRSRIGLNLHTQVSTALGNINVLSEIAKLKVDKNIEQSKDFIDQISDKSRSMIQAMDDMLWSIDPANDSMAKTLLRIRELTENLKAEFEMDIDLIVEHSVSNLQLDMSLRHELYTFYKEQMYFIIDNTYCNQIFVNFRKQRNDLRVELLSECPVPSANFKDKVIQKFKQQPISKNGSLDVSADERSFSVVLSVRVQ